MEGNSKEREQVFRYTYSASEQEEIHRIREKYIAPTQEEDKMERLRRLDRSATKAGAVVSLIVGILGTLALGVGMCCVMVPGWQRFFAPGIVVGVIGIFGVIAAYPLYARMVRKKREQLAPEILKLSEELLK